MFSFIEPVSNSVQESEVMVNPRSEEDYMMLLKTICAKSEGFDDCNTDDDEDEEEEEPNTDDEDCIVDDEEDVDSNESYEYSDEELEEDTNEY